MADERYRLSRRERTFDGRPRIRTLRQVPQRAVASGIGHAAEFRNVTIDRFVGRSEVRLCPFVALEPLGLIGLRVGVVGLWVQRGLPASLARRRNVVAGILEHITVRWIPLAGSLFSYRYLPVRRG